MSEQERVEAMSMSCAELTGNPEGLQVVTLTGNPEGLQVVTPDG